MLSKYRFAVASDADLRPVWLHQLPHFRATFFGSSRPLIAAALRSSRTSRALQQVTAYLHGHGTEGVTVVPFLLACLARLLS